MNAIVQQAFRTQGLHADEPTLLAPDAARILASGNRMPLLGLGTAELTVRTVDTICNALELGFRMIDTCADYHTQRGIGEALRAAGVDRNAIFVITKVGPDEDAYAAVGKSLAQLRLDYVDLVLLQAPPQFGIGESSWQALRRARREGLTRDIGVSNYSIDCIEELVYRSGVLPAVNQVEWSPFGHSPRMLDFCRDNDIVIQAASPLTRARRLDDAKLGVMAARYGKTPAQLLIRWNLQLGVAPLPKANHVTHQRENLNVFGFEILPQDMARLNALNEHFSTSDRLAYL